MTSSRGRCERERLLKILFFKVRVILEQLLAIRIGRENFQHPSDRGSHSANTGLAAHFTRLDRDPVEWRLEIHTTIMPRRGRALRRCADSFDAAATGECQPTSEFRLTPARGQDQNPFQPFRRHRRRWRRASSFAPVAEATDRSPLARVGSRADGSAQPRPSVVRRSVPATAGRSSSCYLDERLRFSFRRGRLYGMEGLAEGPFRRAIGVMSPPQLEHGAPRVTISR